MRTVALASAGVSAAFFDGDWIESKDQDPGGGFRLLQLADVGDGVFRDVSDRFVNHETYERLNCSSVVAGDILIARMPDPIGRACLLPSGIGEAITVVDVAVLRCHRETAIPDFVVYALNSAQVRAEIRAMQDGATRQRVPRKKLGRIQIPLPPLPEQQAIADYLDRETARIDTLITKQESLITLLRERRDAAIAMSFLDGSATRSLRFVLELSQTGPFGTQLRSEEYVANGVPVINPSHIAAGVIVPDPGIGVTHLKAEQLCRYRARAGDVLLGRKGEVDKSAIVSEALDGLVAGSDSLLLRPDSTSVGSKYLWWFLQSTSTHFQLLQWSVGSTVSGLNQTAMSKVQIPVPPLSEQREIVAYLDEQTAKIDALIAKAQRFIELAKERRAALITAAVTGQIDVRDAA